MNRPDHAAELAQAAAEVLALPPQAAALLASEFRHRFGGEVLRIPERAPVTPDLIDARLRAGASVSRIAAETGLHRSTVYRLLARDGLKSRAKPAKCDTAGG